MRRTVAAVAGVVLGVPLLLAAAVTATYLAHRETSGAIDYAGEAREYLLHVPPGLDPRVPAPLVVSLHGAMGWPALQRDITGWNRLADEHRFIVVYPAGRGTGPKAWFMHGADDPPRMPDVRFIGDLLDLLQRRHAIDPRRIYVEGLSNGGGMAYALACTLPQRVAAVGLVAAAMSLPPEWCRNAPPVPMLAIHGTADTIVPYGGGASPIAPKPFPSVPHWAAQWARRNGCSATPAETRPAADLSRKEYGACSQGAGVVLYTVQEGGHQWPGGGVLPEWLLGRRTHSLDAARAMWAFFALHAKVS